MNNSWISNKHPRDTHGRFASKGTSDTPKISKGEARGVSRKAGQLFKDAELHQARLETIRGLSLRQRQRFFGVVLKENIQAKSQKHLPKISKEQAKKTGKEAGQLFKDAVLNRERDEIIQEMSPRQRQRLYGVIVPKKETPIKPAGESKAKAETTSKESVKAQSKKDKNLDKYGYSKLRRLPTERKVVASDSVSATDHKINLWENKEKFREATKGYKVSPDKSFEYGVVTDDGRLSLNNHKTKVMFDGETIYGLPKLHPDRAKYDNIRVVRELAKAMSYVEDSAENAPAPDWRNVYGSPGKQYVASRGLGKMQIHHINQWSKVPFETINKRVESGKITVEQAKAEMRGLLRKTDNVKSGYEIDIQGKNTRTLVILAGGLHDVTSPLYYANHPKGYHPETGVMTEFAIPKNGSGGRDEFNKMRADFWKETYRRESKILAGELTKRLRKGQITKEQFVELFNNERQKLLDFKESVISLKKEREAELKRRKENPLK
ncbi:hypothetical protein CAL7716_053340 [Calothrix sp. PCC 7716]|nr:hypothetical protein CAL7716_053340 [Calothrix sp. PCC 7716]